MSLSLKALLRETVDLKEENLEGLLRVFQIIRDKVDRLAIVGGIPRDFFFKKYLFPNFKIPKTRDIDLVIEGDPQEVVSSLTPFEKRGLLQKAILHDKFMTAEITLKFEEGYQEKILTLDIARAREETYPHPSALPEVKPSTIERDLPRRDFTVNAIAILLSRDLEPEGILAPLCAFEDLAKRTLRTFHRNSFLDDPTRLLRGIRYAARLNLSFHPDSFPEKERLAAAFQSLSKERFTEELRLVLEERNLKRALKLISDYGILKLWGGVDWKPSSKELKALQGAIRHFQRLSKAWRRGFRSTAVALGGLKLIGFDPSSLPLTRALALTSDERKLLEISELIRESFPLTTRERRFEIMRQLIYSNRFDLYPLEVGALLELALRLSEKQSSIWWLKKVLKRLVFSERLLDGYTLRTLGVPPREVGNTLKLVRYYQVLGKVRTRTQALKFIKRALGK